MERALSEVKRRREYQIAMNKKYGITPKSISKPLREKLVERNKELVTPILAIDTNCLTPMDKNKYIKDLKKEMILAAHDLNFELAAEIRDRIRKIEVPI